jgi:hypothetical protein
MAKKKSVKKISKRKILVVIFAVLVTALAAVIAVKTYQHNQDVNKQFAVEKRNYAKVDEQMKGVIAGVKAAAGEPYELHYGHGCGYTAAKYARGQLNCSIFYAFTYQVSSTEEGKRLTLKLLPPIRSIAASSPSTLDQRNITNMGNSYTYYYDLAAPLSCTFDYTLSSKQDHNALKKDTYHEVVTSKFAAEYVYHCGSPVFKALYPDSSK